MLNFKTLQQIFILCNALHNQLNSKDGLILNLYTFYITNVKES